MVAAADPRITHVERLVTAIDLPIGRWDREARLVFCNDHYLGWAGRPREQLLGRSLQELFGDAAWAAAAPAGPDPAPALARAACVDLAAPDAARRRPRPRARG